MYEKMTKMRAEMYDKMTQDYVAKFLAIDEQRSSSNGKTVARLESQIKRLREDNRKLGRTRHNVGCYPPPW